MPLTADERQTVLLQIGVVLEQDIHGQLQELYGAAVALTEKQPDQVNNEVRNAVTHLSRALTAENVQQANDEILKANSHVERAMRDCLKLCVIELHDRIQLALRQIETAHGMLNAALVIRRNQLTDQRKAAFRAETNGHPVLNDFVQLFNDATGFLDELTAHFHLVEAKMSWFQLTIARARRNAAELAIGAVAGMIGALALALFVPDLTEFGKNAQVALHLRKPAVEKPNAPPVPVKAAPQPSPQNPNVPKHA